MVNRISRKIYSLPGVTAGRCSGVNFDFVTFFKAKKDKTGIKPESTWVQETILINNEETGFDRFRQVNLSVPTSRILVLYTT